MPPIISRLYRICLSFLQRTHRRAEAGFSLVEVMVAVSIMAVVGVGIAQFMGSLQKNQRTMQAVAVRNGKVNVSQAVLAANAPKMMAIAIDPTIAQGSGFCPTLRNCINGQGGCPTEPFTCELRDFGGQRMAGTAQNPVRLNLQGGQCPGNASASEACPFESVAWFQRAGDTIEVWTSVRQPANVNLRGMPRLADYDGKAQGSSIRVPISSIQLNCPTGKKLMGFNARGEADCRDLVEGNLNSVISLDSQTLPDGAKVCPANLYMKGISKDGVPICGEYPFVWQYNSTFMCFEGATAPASQHCSRWKVGIRCPDHPHGVPCTSAGEFCWREVSADPVVYGVAPNTTTPSRDIPLNINIPISAQSNWFVTNVSCSYNGSCYPSYGTAITSISAPPAVAATVSIPLNSGYLLRIMRCMRPIRQPGQN